MKDLRDLTDFDKTRSRGWKRVWAGRTVRRGALRLHEVLAPLELRGARPPSRASSRVEAEEPAREVRARRAASEGARLRAPPQRARVPGRRGGRGYVRPGGPGGGDGACIGGGVP